MRRVLTVLLLLIFSHSSLLRAVDSLTGWPQSSQGQEIVVGDFVSGPELEIVVLESQKAKMFGFDGVPIFEWGYPTGNPLQALSGELITESVGPEIVVVLSSAVYVLSARLEFIQEIAPFGFSSFSSIPALADVDGDGELEFVIPKHNGFFPAPNPLGEFQVSHVEPTGVSSSISRLMVSGGEKVAPVGSSSKA